MTRLLFMSDYFQVSLDYLMRGTGKEGHLTKSNSAVRNNAGTERGVAAGTVEIRGAFAVTFRKNV